MDVQVKELIEKIKTDGVKSAEENSSRIVSEAEKKRLPSSRTPRRKRPRSSLRLRTRLPVWSRPVRKL